MIDKAQKLGLCLHVGTKWGLRLGTPCEPALSNKFKMTSLKSIKLARCGLMLLF